MKQVKNILIDKVKLLDDENVIRALIQIVDKLQGASVQKLTENEIELIKLGVEDYKNGRTVDDSELRDDEDKWLSE